MAKRSKPSKKTGGPFLAAAVFCDSIVEAKDNTVSAIRIVDQINVLLHPDTPPDVPSEQNRLPISVNGLLTFRTGYAPGEHKVSIIMESPSGKRQQVLEQTISLGLPPNNGVNINLKSVIAVKSGGLFWMHVLLDGKRVAQMPLQISIQRAEAPAGPPPPAANSQAQSTD